MELQFGQLFALIFRRAWRKRTLESVRLCTLNSVGEMVRFAGGISIADCPSTVSSGPNGGLSFDRELRAERRIAD